jgi:hypothetical protein
MRVEIVTVMTMNINVLLVVTHCAVLADVTCVRKVSCFYLQDRSSFRKVQAGSL